jgi:hypothetical protein
MLIEYAGPFRAVRVVPENGRPFRIERGTIGELDDKLAKSLLRSPDWRTPVLVSSDSLIRKAG